MESSRTGFGSIDEYIGTFPGETQAILQELRAAIRAAAPDAEEKISYQMPTFKLNGNLVHFAAFEKHIGFYPTPSGVEKFKDRLSACKMAKGSIQFPINKALPFDIIREIVKFRVQENLEKKKQKK